MKKIGFLILFSLIIQGCNSHPTAENNENSTHMSIAPVQTGNNQVEETRPDDPNIPNCEPLDLKPIKPEEVIKIDDVVQNCRYEIGNIVYNDKIGRAGFHFGKVKIRKNFFTWEDDMHSDIACEYHGLKYAKIDPYDTPSGTLDLDKQNFLNLLKRHKFQKKQILSITSELHSLLGEEALYHYGCQEKKLCSRLITKTFDENKNHYFLYSYDFRENILIIDDKRYGLGRTKYSKTLPIIIETGPWVPARLSGNKLIVNRFTNGKVTNLEKKQYELGDAMGTFQLTTCEIPL